MMEINFKTILAKLPYSEPFLFVDELSAVHKDGAEGSYTFRADADFYRGHFKGHPVTPGVILTECMAQIGLACLGIYLSEEDARNEMMPFALTDSKVDYFLPVYPGETVYVTSEKVYFRFGKLRCRVRMVNSEDKLVCLGTLSGMILKKQ